MDKSAIESLAKMAVASDAKLDDFNVVLVPNDYKLESTERFDTVPAFYRAKFDTSVFSEFTAYIDAHGNTDTQVFIDNHSMTALAILDMGNTNEAQWGKHRAKLELIKTPAYAALLKLANAPLPQQAMIDFFEDWIGNIKFFFDDEKRVESFAQTIKTLRRLKINANASTEQTVGNFAKNRSALESIEITAGSDELPAGFWFEVIPYEEFKRVIFTCQLRAVNDEKNVVLKYRLGQQELITITIAQEFRDELKVKLLYSQPDIKTFIGTMAYQI